MKVIEEGPAEWSDTLDCNRCGSRFEVTQDDLELDGFKTSGLFFAGTAVCEDRFFVSCPVCPGEKYLFVPDADLPVLLRDRMTAAKNKLERERGY